jgi:hypothetical protein
MRANKNDAADGEIRPAIPQVTQVQLQIVANCDVHRMPVHLSSTVPSLSISQCLLKLASEAS